MRGYANQLGQRIRTLRREQGLTLERLAYESGADDDVGLTKGYLSKIERGQQLPSIEVLCKLAARLDVDAYQLLVFPESNESAAAVDLIRDLPNERTSDLLTALRSELASLGSR